MKKHSFIFEPGFWLGEGKININVTGDELSFYMRWSIARPEDIGPIECIQEIQIVGLADIMHNKFLIKPDPEGLIQVELTSQVMGSVQGTGLVEPNKIAWEFDHPEIGFSAFELYEKLDDRHYKVYGENSSSEQFRTTIRGKIWKKET